MQWGQIGTTPELPTLSAKFHYYRTHHPIIMGFAYIGIMGIGMWGWLLSQSNIRRPIKKYKDAYVVYRPDDPHVKILRTGPIGLDKWNNGVK